MRTINKLNKINEICLQIQDKELATMFVRYAGHVNNIYIMIYPGRYITEYPEKDIIYKEINCDDTDKTYNDLQYFKLLYYLQSILITEKFDKQ